MDNGNYKYGTALQRHLSPLKLISRLLSHEMHAQSGSKAVSFSREQVIEIQAAIDLFIEEAARKQGGAGSGGSSSTLSSSALGLSGGGYGPTGGGYGPNGGGSTSLTPTALETTFVPTRN
jgi:uncharacterized membrane protein